MPSLAVAAIWPAAFFYFQDEERRPQRPEEASLYAVRQRIGSVRHWHELLRELFLQPASRDVRLVALAGILSLSSLEILTTALCLAVEEDSHMAAMVALLQPHIGSARPSVGLVADTLGSLLTGSVEESPSYLLATGTAARTGLLRRINESAPLCDQQLGIPAPLTYSLRGIFQPWPGTRFASRAEPETVPETLTREARAHASALSETSRCHLVIRSPSPREAEMAAVQVCRALGRRPVFARAASIPLEGFGLYCTLERLVPVFVLETAPGVVVPLPSAPGYSGPVLALAGPDGAVQSDENEVYQWRTPLPGPEERRRLWLKMVEDPVLAQSLAASHLQGTDRIRSLGTLARMKARVNGRFQVQSQDVRRAAFQVGGLETLAQPVPEEIPEKALILTESTRKTLEMLEARCRHREDLPHHLGVTLEASYRTGVRALFVGPSGTGKTLAASWLATRLGFALYRVDLAAVMSKYVGETEKNLSALLAAAEEADVILLFDEADSLFGKRTEVRDANDRFANAQTNYLLQRLEHYRGIVLLTSNSRARMDASFSRRIDLVVEFPAPGPEERRALWKSHLGDAHDLQPGDVNLLAAHADLCGGHIRNAVLAAAVRALEQGRRVQWRDVLEGLRLEYAKLGRQIPAELLGAPRGGSFEREPQINTNERE
ncbi:ATPase family associated with various cellular activities (AAA) [Desulfacinum infernum DSM 9756]|uniref:ATPase family associated with various cellular activities (AAA) n=2 Tax=Desulfacinum infernum TaxID=35837 RepID=A0A1M4WKP7_9BACT|nr:ATPase family associated with various cellular activities (AAA) [Desulfacinum infernum DSM 9756]